ncbi:MAG: hypothetical protein JNM57_09200 [Cyclobacteriaceae bacterium]|nr:hypothetical protein [Cyclobacteriaceae bacterium]
MKTIIVITCLIVMQLPVMAQDQDPSAEWSKVNIGLGIGIDYGGFGGRFTVLPAERFGLFLGLGYNLVGAGYNVGATYRFLPAKRVCPTINAMYGYNGVIKVQNASQFDKAYYGASIGGGVEFRTRNPKNYFNLELIIPFRPQAFYDDVDDLKNNSAIEFQTEPIPIAFSIGYHFGL